MYITKTINVSRYFKFKVKKIHIPGSMNRLGVDILPRHFHRPTELLEVMLYSKDPRSVDWGYTRDQETKLYLKNIDDIFQEEIDARFIALSMNPPFWYADENGYEEFMKVNLSPTLAKWLQDDWQKEDSSPKYVKDGDVDIPVPYYYTTGHRYKLMKYPIGKLVQWPKNKILHFDKTINKQT